MNIFEFMRNEGVRPAYFAHVRTILHHCHGERQKMQDAIDELRRNQPTWFW